TAPTAISTPSLHDALPIWPSGFKSGRNSASGQFEDGEHKRAEYHNAQGGLERAAHHEHPDECGGLYRKCGQRGAHGCAAPISGKSRRDRHGTEAATGDRKSVV